MTLDLLGLALTVAFIAGLVWLVAACEHTATELHRETAARSSPQATFTRRVVSAPARSRHR